MKNIIYAKCINIVMHKTQHRRRHRHRHRRTRRGGSHSASNAAHAASAASAASAPAAAATRSPQLQAILDKVRAYAAMTPAPSSTKVKGISKQDASKKRLQGIMSGKVSHSDKSASKHGSRNRPGPGQ